MENSVKNAGKKKVSYAKWGYIFVASFFIVYLIFTLVPQILTIYDSFFDYSNTAGLSNAATPFCGFQNYINLFDPNYKVNELVGYVKIVKYMENTLIIWIIGAVPQLIVSLLLALIFTSTRLKLKGTGFFKTVFYMPNLIMATAFAALFLLLFGTISPIHTFAVSKGWIPQIFDFIQNKVWGRLLVAFMNFLMWFGNTTILLMAGIQSIDESLFEAARIDGANSRHVLFDITLPLLKPIVVYVLITSMIGGLQMYDVPQVLTASHGTFSNDNTVTMIMYLNSTLTGTLKNYGSAGAISVILFIITGILSIFVFKSINRKED